MKPARALLVVLSLCVSSAYSQTSQGSLALETKIVEGLGDCTMTDLAVELINDRASTCGQGQSHFFNGERRSVNHGIVYPLDGEHVQNGYELSACACSQNGTWTRTMQLVTTTVASSIRWTWKYYARKADCSLELKRSLVQIGCWQTLDSELPYCPEGFSYSEGSADDPTPRCLPISPIVIDLDGDGLRLTDRAGGVTFDVDGDGHTGQVSWLAEDGWLVLNERPDGRVVDGRQFFGDLSTQEPNSVFEQPNGYAALRVFDDNGDEVIDVRDGVWELLGIWRDVNRNGTSEPGEVHGLTETGIASLSLNYKSSGRRDRHGNELRYRARVQWASGRRTSSWDVWLTAD